MPRAAVLFLIASVTLCLQFWVGRSTIYHPANVEARENLHRYFFANELPAGATWADLGASNGLNMRVGVVFMAEGFRRAFGTSISRTYFLFDTVALATSLVLLLLYLRHWVKPATALVGLLYFATVLPLTYYMHVFHPWDRLSLALWIALLILLRDGKLLWFAGLLGASVAVKFDTVLLPGLHWLANTSRTNWGRTFATTLLLFVISMGTLGLLLALRPGSDTADFGAQFAVNVAGFRQLRWAYPPILMLGLPLLLSTVGFPAGDRFTRASTGFAVLMLAPLFLLTNFAEVRAAVPVLVLLLPGALRAFEAMTEGVESPPGNPSAQGTMTA